jgi:hypothetical protein
MNDDFDPAISDALHRLADAAPQPREDRLKSVVAGARRRQVRVVAASAVGVVALVTATALGVHSWHDAATVNPLPASSLDGLPTMSQPPASVEPATPTLSSAPSGSPAAQAQTQPRSAATTAGGRAASTGAGATTEAEPKVGIQLSSTNVAADQQIRVTVTIRNAGGAALPSSVVSIGTMIPDDGFDTVPASCTRAPGGATCPVATLGGGQKKVLVFAITLSQSPSDFDEIFGTLVYTDRHGQPQSVDFGEQVAVDNSTPPSPPLSSPPGIVDSPSPANSAASSSPLATTPAGE